MKAIRKSVSKFWGILGPYLFQQKIRFTGLILLQLATITFTIILPQIMKGFINSAKSGISEKMLLIMGVAYIAISIIQQITTVLTRYSGEVLAWTATNHLRFDLAQHCLSLDMTFHNDKSPGELIERIDGDVHAFSNFFSQLVIMVIGNLILLSGILIVLFIEDYRIGLLFLGFSATTLFLLNRVRNVAVPYEKARREVVTELFGFLEERLAGAEDIKANGGISYVVYGLYKVSVRFFRAWHKAGMAHIVIRFVAGICMVSGFVISMVGGYNLYQHSILTIGAVYMMIQYTQSIGQPIRVLTRQIENLQNVGANVDRIHDLKNETGKLEDNGTETVHGHCEVQFNKVSFFYRKDETVLKNVSFSIPPGKVLGLLGKTGSGKSTIGRLICRFYDPTDGTVSLDGTSLTELKLHDLRNNIAYVTQEVQLFQASVRDNLTFFNRDIPDSKLIEVIDTLGLSGWLNGLEKGLDTRLKSGAKDLSAGQAQLLAFTRAFLRQPGIVILDEASSRLDPVTENLIENAMDKLLENRTAIIIAHRLSTLNRADYILLLEDGKVAEYGEQSKLLKDPKSKFKMLLAKGFQEELA